MSVRSVKRELEAKLKAESGRLFSKPSGKVERKTYGDGAERLKISLRNLDVPEGSLATIVVDGHEISQIMLVKGAGRLDNESRDTKSIPSFEAGQIVEVYVDGEKQLGGKLYVD